MFPIGLRAAFGPGIMATASTPSLIWMRHNLMVGSAKLVSTAKIPLIFLIAFNASFVLLHIGRTHIFALAWGGIFHLLPLPWLNRISQKIEYLKVTYWFAQLSFPPYALWQYSYPFSDKIKKRLLMLDRGFPHHSATLTVRRLLRIERFMKCNLAVHKAPGAGDCWSSRLRWSRLQAGFQTKNTWLSWRERGRLNRILSSFESWNPRDLCSFDIREQQLQSNKDFRGCKNNCRRCQRIFQRQTTKRWNYLSILIFHKAFERYSDNGKRENICCISFTGAEPGDALFATNTVIGAGRAETRREYGRIWTGRFLASANRVLQTCCNGCWARIWDQLFDAAEWRCSPLCYWLRWLFYYCSVDKTWSARQAKMPIKT